MGAVILSDSLSQLDQWAPALRSVYSKTATAQSLRYDAVTSPIGLDHQVTMVWSVRQIRYLLDANAVKPIMPSIVRFGGGVPRKRNTKLFETMILKDWGGIQHRVTRVQDIGWTRDWALIYPHNGRIKIKMEDFFAKRWQYRGEMIGVYQVAGKRFSVHPKSHKQSAQKAKEESWQPDGGMRLVPHVRGKPIKPYP